MFRKMRQRLAQVREAKQLVVEEAAAHRVQEAIDLEARMATFMADLRAGEIQLGSAVLISLKQGEETLMNIPYVILSESRAIRTGAHMGARVRVAKGASIGGGRFESESHDELRVIDTGTFTLTDRRIVYSGELRTHVIPLRKVVAVKVVQGNIAINYEGRQKTQYFKFPSFGARDELLHVETVTPQMLLNVIEGVLDRVDVS